jgi:hypothetical protein
MLSSRDRGEMQTEAAKSQAAGRGVTRQRIARCQAQEAAEDMPQDRGLQDLKL